MDASKLSFEEANLLRESLIQGSVLHRKTELMALIEAAKDGPVKTQLLIELKKLMLLRYQSQLRSDILHDYRKRTVLFSCLNPYEYRVIDRNFSFSFQRTKLLEEANRRYLLQKERAKKTDYFLKLFNHYSKFKSFHKSIQQKKENLEKEVFKKHQQIIALKKQQEEIMERERMRLLLEDNEEAYRALLKEKKDNRLEYLLTRTDNYINEFKRLVLQRNKIFKNERFALEEGDPGAVHVDGHMEFDAEDEKKSYYFIAHALGEVIDKQPSMLTGGRLKPYQMQGLEWLVSIFNNNLNGVLADEMGLGKTIQSIALICYLVEHKKFNYPFLILVPLSTLTNWSLEFQKWSPTLRILRYKGNKSERIKLREKLKEGNFDVCLTTYEMCINKEDKSTLSKVPFRYLIIDEGHRLKNADSKLATTLKNDYKIHHRLLLTGTPLQNNLPELWGLMNFLLPDIFKSCDTFEDWFNRPFQSLGEKTELSKEETMLVIRGLHKVLRPFILRRMKSEVLLQLPQKTTHILKIQMSPLQKQIYSQIKQRILVTGSAFKAKARFLNNTMVQLRKVCNHPFLFEEVESHVNPSKQTNDFIYKVSAKFELLDRIFAKMRATGHRVLLFSQMTSLLTLLEDFMFYRGYKYIRLDGQTTSQERGDLLDIFNRENSDYLVFILSTRAGGLGLNLQAADTVIIFDCDWNPHQDMQAEDRAHRIGQKREVRVLKFVTTNSIEEYILDTATRKLNMDAKVIQAGRFDQKTSADERRKMLEIMLKEEEEQEDLKDNSAHSLEEVNEMLARTEEEMKIFEEIDRKLIMEAGGSFENRLILPSEIPKIYEDTFLSFLQAQEMEVVSENLGRGRREKALHYNNNYFAEADFDRSAKPNEVYSKDRNSRQLSFSAPRNRDFIEQKIKKFKSETTSMASHVVPNSLKRTFRKIFKSIKNLKVDNRLVCGLFLHLPKPTEYPDYYFVIERLMDLKTIKTRIENNKYKSLKDFEKDIELLVSNAHLYNSDDSLVYNDATLILNKFRELKSAFGKRRKGGNENSFTSEEKRFKKNENQFKKEELGI